MNIFDIVSIDSVISEIQERQGMPWNSYISKHRSFPHLEKLFQLMNSECHIEDFFYKGDLFRIHCQRVTLAPLDENAFDHIGKPMQDGSCTVIDKTMFDDRTVVSFTKNADFYDNKIWNKVQSNKKALIFHINTGNNYGIDVNKLLKRSGSTCPNTNYEEENEVLFPLSKQHIIHVYSCTPRQFEYYMRKQSI